MKELHDITLYVDGSSLGNPGVGSAHWVMEHAGKKSPRYSCRLKEPGVTNNYAELAAMSYGLASLKAGILRHKNDPKTYRVRVMSDSKTALGWLKKAPSMSVPKREALMRMRTHLEEIRKAFWGVSFEWHTGVGNPADPGYKER